MSLWLNVRVLYFSFLSLNRQLAMLVLLVVVALLGPSGLVLAGGGGGGIKSPARLIAQRLEQEPDTVVVEQQQQIETPATTYYNPSSAYRFAYSTGQVQSAQLNQQEVAQHFREEQRDALGYVTGKYGYIDPYGKLRVVNYRAGPDGYHAYGDVGPDEEVVRQQRLLYAHDQAARLQQNAWARYKASNSAASSSSSSSASASSDWTSISTNNRPVVVPTGGYKTTSSRYVSSVKSPVAALRDYSTSSSSAKTVYKASYTRPAEVSKTTTTTTYVKPTVSRTTTYSRYVDQSPVVVPVKTQRHSYYYAIPSKTSSRYVTKTAYQSPSARLIEVRQQRQELHQDKAVTDAEYASSASSSSAASAAASASASTSASASSSASSSSSASNTSRGNEQIQQLRSSRYTSPGRAVVNFKSFGPSPYTYSYSF